MFLRDFLDTYFTIKALTRRIYDTRYVNNLQLAVYFLMDWLSSTIIPYITKRVNSLGLLNILYATYID